LTRALVLGLDFGGSKIAAAVADETGYRLAQTTVTTDPARGARWNFDRGVEAAQTLLDRIGAGSPAAVGACTFGIPMRDGVSLAPAIAGWESLALRDELAAALGCEVVRVATDVKAAATVEAESGALAGHDPAIYVNLGTGLATALLVEGRVVVGANGAAGEIAYNVPRTAERGVMLENLVSGGALAAAARARTGLELTAADVFAREAEDPRLEAIVDAFLAELAFHLVNLSVAVDPSRIAVGGGMVRSWSRLEQPLREALHQHVPFPPELVPAAFPYDAVLDGAVRIAVEALHDLIPTTRRSEA
jgi:glucokinase